VFHKLLPAGIIVKCKIAQKRHTVLGSRHWPVKIATRVDLGSIREHVLEAVRIPTGSVKDGSAEDQAAKMSPAARTQEEESS
jgi:hypothetical protein